MIEITDTNHVLVLNASLNKSYNKARITGRLTPQDTYLLNTIFNLLNDPNITLTHEQKKQLECLYITLYNYSQYICKPEGITGYKGKSIFTPQFVVADKDENSGEPISTIAKISYWQEPLGVIYNEIIDLIATGTYVPTKHASTRDAFIIGVDIPYTDIGLIAFAINCNTEGDTFKLYDHLNNDVTAGFQSSYNTDLGLRIFISYNIYSHGTMNFKIKEI